MLDDNARSGFESNPSPDGFSAMPSDLSVNGAARGRGHAWTPGPWEVHRANTTRLGWDVQTEGGKDLVAFNLREANAHLIAAAPELYAALDAALGALIECGCDDNDMGASAIASARLALSRARGECDSKGGA